VSRALSAELFKLRTTRTSWGVTLGSVGLVVIISVIAALAGEFSPGDEAPGLDLMEIAGLVQIFALVLGILIVATEFRHGTITPSLLAVPDRVRLSLAKLLAAIGAGALLGLVAAGLCAAIIFPILSSRGVESGGSTSEVIELIAGNTAASALFAGIGVGLGALIRNQVGAIIGALGWIFLVEPLLGIIPGFSDVIQKWFPSGAVNETAGTSGLDDPLGQVAAGALLAAYAAAFVVAGIAVVRRRDISA
jgi:ABC-2 type transport system permease protein